MSSEPTTAPSEVQKQQPEEVQPTDDSGEGIPQADNGGEHLDEGNLSEDECYYSDDDLQEDPVALRVFEEREMATFGSFDILNELN